MQRSRSRPRARKSRYWLRVALIVLFLLFFVVAPTFTLVLSGVSGGGPSAPATAIPAGR
jgi:hypothetical protein